MSQQVGDMKGTRTFAWGDNRAGQLGDGTTGNNRTTPVPVVGLTNVIAMAAGKAHSLALLDDGTVRAWGSNYYGKLGDGTTTATQPTPVPVVGLTNVIAVAAGLYHSLAVLNDGTARAWGINNAGQLGDGTTGNRTTPVPVVGLTNVIAMATFDRHGLAVLDDGTVRAWGDNDVGQLGDGTTDFRLTPVPVVGLTNVIAVAAGLVHSLALLDDGTVCAWGGGEGATPQHTPVPVVGLTNVIAVAAGEYHNLALLGDGTVRGWGLDLYGYLGTGLTTAIQLTPVPVVGLTNVIAVAAGTFHTLALLNDGTVRALGLNGLGQLGDGAITEAQLTPVPVVGLTNVRNVAAGANHSLAMVGVLP